MPNLRGDDTRLAKDSRKRIIFCCSCNYKFYRIIGFDGDYIHLPDELKLCTTWEDAQWIMKDMWERKVWNAAWFCCWCWQLLYTNECGQWISLEDVRRKLGIVQQQDLEIARRQQRTNFGSRRDNPQLNRHPEFQQYKRAHHYV